MANRRTFLGGLLAAGLAPKASWADVGRPAFLSAARRPDGSYVLCGLSADGQILFERPLPARGHAAAAHPTRPEAVAFARRPGTFAIVLDCGTGQQTARLTAPEGRHFYGHGAFSGNGDLLFTTENDFDAAKGVVGVWDARRGYARIGEFASGGVGPHDIKIMPDGATLVVANGGIETHPETGRTKLNIPSMRPNLSYLSLEGELLANLELDGSHRQNSIRHLAVADTGAVAFAMQWQGDLSDDLPLLGVHDRSADTVLLLEHTAIREMNGYLGSVAVSGDGTRIAATSPRSGVAHVIRGGEHRLIDANDISGVSWSGDGFVFTTGNGTILQQGGETRSHGAAWDNHLVAI